MMKSKQIKFKNPFDLMEEDEEEQAIAVQKAYPSSSQSKTIKPLPFNPYKIEPIVEPVRQKPVPAERKHDAVAAMSRFEDHDLLKVGVDSSLNFKSEPQKPGELNEDGDPPLLEDLGIQPGKIKQRVLAVLKISKPSYEMIEQPDLSGPIVIGLCLGFLLLLAGKVHFGDIYAMFIFGNLMIYFLLNFMSQVNHTKMQIDIIPLYNIMSTLGYGLLPMLLLGLFGVFVNLKGSLGIIIGLGIACWSSFAAGNIMDTIMKDEHNSKKVLLTYPLFLFYVSFCMIVIF